MKRLFSCRRERRGRERERFKNTRKKKSTQRRSYKNKSRKNGVLRFTTRQRRNVSQADTGLLSLLSKVSVSFFGFVLSSGVLITDSCYKSLFVLSVHGAFQSSTLQSLGRIDKPLLIPTPGNFSLSYFLSTFQSAGGQRRPPRLPSKVTAV